MTNEEILNIVKLEYSGARISEEGRIVMGESGHYEEIDGVEKFVAEVLICIKNNKIKKISQIRPTWLKDFEKFNHIKKAYM